MHVITDKKYLPRTSLMAIASVGWLVLLYLCWVVLQDSVDRALFAVAALQGQIPAEIDPFIDRYTAHPLQTLAHTATGVVFATLGPLQFAAPLRRRFPIAHRLSGRLFLLAAFTSGISAFIISLSFPMWGASVNALIGVVASIFMLFCFAYALYLIKKRRIAAHREWMMRGFATGIAVAVFRVGLDNILPPLGFNAMQSWNIVTATCFPVTLFFAEAWIIATRVKRASAGAVAPPSVQPES